MTERRGWADKVAGEVNPRAAGDARNAEDGPVPHAGEGTRSSPGLGPGASTYPRPGQIEFLQWHLERYDARRVSTAARASVVLSAGAILSAGDALVLGQLSDTKFTGGTNWLMVVMGVVTLASVSLVIGALIRASQVLVTRRSSRSLFDPGGDLPAGLLFNDTDTVERLQSFAEFRAAIDNQSAADVVDAAAVELWITIHQHRLRYSQLRSSVLLLQYAGASFIVILLVTVVIHLIVN